MARMNFADVNDPAVRRKAQIQNAEYVRKTSSAVSREKVSALHARQLEPYLKETAVFDKVLTPRDVDPSECDTSVDSETLFYKLYYPFETRAYLGSFEGRTRQYQEVFIPQIFLSFYLLTTPTYVLNDYNVMRYPFPVLQQVQDTFGIDLQEARDWGMKKSLDDTLQAGRAENGNILRGAQAQADLLANLARGSGGGAAGTFRGRLEAEDIVTLKQYFAGKRTRLAKAVITEMDWLDVERFDLQDFGDNLKGDVVVEGYKMTTLHGVEFLRTIKCDASKGDVFRPGNIYGFASEREVGVSLTLRGQKVYMDRDHQMLYIDAQSAHGHMWAVNDRVCKLELYNGGLDGLGNRNAVIAAGVDANAPGTPASDTTLDDPEYVTERDYFNIEQEYNRPAVTFG